MGSLKPVKNLIEAISDEHHAVWSHK